jgi:anti-sigma regulatory factor (Ser/Thr protein kinase)
MANKLTIKASAFNLDVVLEFLGEELNRYKVPEPVQADINVAVEELFSNIANYAYQPGKDGETTLYVVSDGKKVVLRFEDTGVPYNPLERADPYLDVPLEDREIGGLGIYFVKQLMDSVKYTYTDGKNTLTMSKNFN